MIPVSEIYDAVYNDYVNSPENGEVTISEFNRFSKLAELRIMDYISGDIENLKPPAPYTSQKIKDYLSLFITQYKTDVKNGKITQPKDYYGFENMHFIGKDSVGCEVEEVVSGDFYNQVALVDGNKFNRRSKTSIERKKPSFKKPICKMVGEDFFFNPKDLGNVVLEYYRYPKFAKAIPKMDTDFNIEVVDEATSINYEYGEWARELLIYFIARQFTIKTREDSLLQHTQVVGKLVRDEK